MNIAFLHNVQLEPVPEQAEFDTPETIRAIVEALESKGHRVTPLDAAGHLDQLVSKLKALQPEVVLNTAEGTVGRGREGFYPELLDQLGLLYTGSDSYVCNLTLDKYLTNLALSQVGITVPASLFLLDKAQLEDFRLNFPVIVKPNFEGSSKGITSDSICADKVALEKTVSRLLAEYPSGLLIEEFITGLDVTVPYIEKVGVLEPAHYEFGNCDAEHPIYDYDLKQNRPDDVRVICPAKVDEKTKRLLTKFTKLALRRLGVRDFARVDFRVDKSGHPVLIEVNALPSLEPGAAIYLGAAEKGLDNVPDVLDAILKSALKRKPPTPKNSKKRVPKFGLVYNLRRRASTLDRDEEAEFDSETTVNALAQAISEAGYPVTTLEATPELAGNLGGIDIVFNIAEGLKGRYRESQVPALLELLDIEFTGSEAGPLAVCHDKGLAKRLVRQAGFLTPDFQVVQSCKGLNAEKFRYPVIVKPVAEGSSKGILPRSVVSTPQELTALVKEMTERYGQPMMVEDFLPGREFTVGLLGGGSRPRVLPIMEIVLPAEKKNPIYSFQDKLDDTTPIRFETPAKLTPALEKNIVETARGAFAALGCRDVARIDLRLDAQGRVNFVECNPLPGLSPDFSDLCVLAKACGMDYKALVKEILTPAVKRFRRKIRKP